MFRNQRPDLYCRLKVSWSFVPIHVSAQTDEIPLARRKVRKARDRAVKDFMASVGDIVFHHKGILGEIVGGSSDVHDDCLVGTRHQLRGWPKCFTSDFHALMLLL